MQTDILIPLGTGSKFDNIELRFCLRSIEMHLLDIRNIFIIGECPAWVKNCFRIFCEDKPGVINRAYNIYKKIMLGCSNPDLSENFLFLNDDHFLLKDFEAADFPYLHRGPIIPHRIGNEAQERQMSNTVKMLKNVVDESYDYDIHCPIVYNKEIFSKMLADLLWPEFGYGIKSLYGNSVAKAILKNSFCEDLKFSEPLSKRNIYKALEGKDWFSVSDKTLRLGEMQEVLQELYPSPSKYET